MLLVAAVGAVAGCTGDSAPGMPGPVLTSAFGSTFESPLEDHPWKVCGFHGGKN